MQNCSTGVVKMVKIAVRREFFLFLFFFSFGLNGDI